jgi:fructose-1,6-bisphosphatase/inositol monophosphatase family enzyme
LIELPESASGRAATEVAREAAALAGDIILPRFRDNGARSPDKVAKGRGNFVTETDLACEEAVLVLLRREYPGHRILSEETAERVEGWDRGWLWVMDPLDGTSNFTRGIPTFAFNLALCLDGEPVLGITTNPATRDEFFAVKGGGLRVNGSPATVSTAPTLAESLLGMGLGYDYDRAKKMLELLTGLWPGVQMLQNIGSAALGLAYTASGRFDVYVHHLLFPWDMAAGILLVREGGGLFLDRDGGQVTPYSEGVIAGAPGPVTELAGLIAGTAWR